MSICALYLASSDILSGVTVEIYESNFRKQAHANVVNIFLIHNKCVFGVLTWKNFLQFVERRDSYTLLLLITATY